MEIYRWRARDEALWRDSSPKNKNYVIYYWRRSKPVSPLFIFGTQSRSFDAFQELSEPPIDGKDPLWTAMNRPLKQEVTVWPSSKMANHCLFCLHAMYEMSWFIAKFAGVL